MRYFPVALEKLTEQFAKLPGIGGKTAQRLAFHLLSMQPEEAQEFADAIVQAKKTVHLCPVCQNLTDKDICPICDDDSAIAVSSVWLPSRRMSSRWSAQENFRVFTMFCTA